MPLPPTALPEFRDSQIIYLQHGRIRLYAETIQLVKPRQLCWARPLALIRLPDEQDNNSYQPLILRDLRQGSDLLLPASLFCIALDVEVIPVITQLNAPKSSLSTEVLADNSQFSLPLLQNFVCQVWQAHPEHFSESPSLESTTLQVRN